MSDAGGIERRIDGARATLWLSRPEKRNALSPETIEALTGALQRIDEDESIQVVTLQGKGKSFCVGADLIGFGHLLTQGKPDRKGLLALAEAGDRLIWTLAHLRPITIAAVTGHAIGGGFLLAAACDLRVAQKDARFGIPEVELGLPLAWLGVPLLIRELGRSLARDLIMTGIQRSAADLQHCGFIHRLVDSDEDCARELEALAKHQLAMPTSALRMSKRQMTEPLASEAYRRQDAEMFVEAITDADFLPAAMRYMQRLSQR